MARLHATTSGLLVARLKSWCRSCRRVPCRRSHDSRGSCTVLLHGLGAGAAAAQRPDSDRRESCGYASGTGAGQCAQASATARRCARAWLWGGGAQLPVFLGAGHALFGAAGTPAPSPSALLSALGDEGVLGALSQVRVPRRFARGRPWQSRSRTRGPFGICISRMGLPFDICMSPCAQFRAAVLGAIAAWAMIAPFACASLYGTFTIASRWFLDRRAAAGAGGTAEHIHEM